MRVSCMPSQYANQLIWLLDYRELSTSCDGSKLVIGHVDGALELRSIGTAERG